MGNSPADQHLKIDLDPTSLVEPDVAAEAQEFAATQIGESTEGAENPNDWWSESADGRCSENAALFAASQPAPLSIV